MYLGLITWAASIRDLLPIVIGEVDAFALPEEGLFSFDRYY